MSRGPIEDAFHQFKQLLTRQKSNGLDWEAQELTDEDHGSVVLRSHYAALRKIYSDWRIPQDPDSGQVAVDLKGADDHYKKLSEKFGFTLPGAGKLDQPDRVSIAVCRQARRCHRDV